MGTSVTKQQLREAIDQLPDNATAEDAIERLCFLAKVDEGLRQSAAGETLPHHEAIHRLMA